MPGENETQQSEQTAQTTGTESTTQNQGTSETQQTARRSLLNEQGTEQAQQTPEQKAGADRLAAEADKGKKPSGAPETYTPFTAPEGYTLDEKTLAEASPLFKELGLSQESAQKLVDFYGKNALSAVEGPYKEWADTQEKWVKDVKAEHGSKLDSVRASIGRAIDQLGPDLGKTFREAMDFTGAGNNPAFVNALSKWASMLAEGSSVRGNGPTDGSPPGAKPSIAQALYPTLPSAAKG